MNAQNRQLAKWLDPNLLEQREPHGRGEAVDIVNDDTHALALVLALLTHGYGVNLNPVSRASAVVTTPAGHSCAASTATGNWRLALRDAAYQAVAQYRSQKK